MPFPSLKSVKSVLVAAVSCVAGLAPAQSMVISDFESDSFRPWTIEGTAFSNGPTVGAVAGQKGIKMFGGERLANSGAGGDAATGRLRSPEFIIEKNRIRFLIGGAELPQSATMNLIVGEKVVRTATGLGAKINRSQIMRYEDWNVAEFRGQSARIELIDAATKAAGHILVDDVLQTDEALQSPSFELRISKRYLLLPVKNQARPLPLQMHVGTNMVREFEIELATDGSPDWWAFSDMQDYVGRTIMISTPDRLPAKHAAVFPNLLRQSKAPIEADDVYSESNRPQFHFTVRRGFNNDPNGLVFYNGEYHMFYQNNPYGIEWNNMHWGHAVSRDLVRWTELPPAIYPRGLAGGAYSGGAFVDYGNKLGYGKRREDVLLISYTGIGRGECLAYGTGRVLSLTDIPENPVLRHSGWDPNVMRYEPANKWLMLVFERKLPSYGYAFYDSTNLLSWRKLGLIEGFQDCPDFFELPVDGEKTRRWVLYGSKKEATNRYASKSSYMIGTFDGEKFTPETEIIEGHLGPQFYAGQTFKEMPDKRRVILGWLNGAKYSGMPFSQGMTVPLELKLRRSSEGIRMTFYPVRELEKLRTRNRQTGRNLTPESANALLQKSDAELLDLEASIKVPSQGKFTFSVHGVPIHYDSGLAEVSCKDTKAKVQSQNGVIHLRVLADRGVLEIFINKGEAAMAFGGSVYPKQRVLKIEASPETSIVELRATELKSIWNR